MGLLWISGFKGANKILEDETKQLELWKSSKYSSNKEGQIAAVNALVTANDKADVKIKRQSEHGF